VWRVIKAGLATLREIDEHWCINDLADANLVLDLQAEADARAMKEARK